MLTLDEVLKSLPKKEVVKTASTFTQTNEGFVKSLAEATRSIPDVSVSWSSMNAVKNAGFRSPPPSLVFLDSTVDDEKPGTPLRKLAHALRHVDNERAVQLFEKTALALRAIRGLTLLKEKVI